MEVNNMAPAVNLCEWKNIVRQKLINTPACNRPRKSIEAQRTLEKITVLADATRRRWEYGLSSGAIRKIGNGYSICKMTK